MAREMKEGYCWECGHVRDCHIYHWVYTFDIDGVVCDNFTDAEKRAQMVAQSKEGANMGRWRRVNAKTGERLLWLRQVNDKSQQVVADFVGIHQTTLGAYERGLYMPGAGVLTRLANYYDVSLDFLLGRTDVKKNLNV